MKKLVGIVSACLIIPSLVPAYASMNKDDVENKPTLKKIMKDEIKDDVKTQEKSWVDNLSGSLAFTSDYVFRGVSQSQNLPAVQGGLTYALPYNLYFNLWGSNVRFAGTDASVEFDTALGIGGEFLDALKYDVNVARYNYARARDLNYNELNTLFNYRFIQLAFSYSANVYNTHKTGIYYNAGINYDIPSQYALGFENLNFIALLGHYSLPRAAGNSYNDYMIALSKAFKKYALTVQWTDTNGRQKNPPYDSGIIAASISAEF